MKDLSICRLKSTHDEVLDITFLPVHYPPNPGSSAWQLAAEMVAFRLHTPERTEASSFLIRFRATLLNPFCVVKQCVVLYPMSQHDFVGQSMLPLCILDGSSGMEERFKQYVLVDRLFSPFRPQDPNPFRPDPLIDPINQTNLFQIDMFAATPYAKVNMAEWGNI